MKNKKNQNINTPHHRKKKKEKERIEVGKGSMEVPPSFRVRLGLVRLLGDGRDYAWLQAYSADSHTMLDRHNARPDAMLLQLSLGGTSRLCPSLPSRRIKMLRRQKMRFPRDLPRLLVYVSPTCDPSIFLLLS